MQRRGSSSGVQRPSSVGRNVAEKSKERRKKNEWGFPAAEYDAAFEELRRRAAGQFPPRRQRGGPPRARNHRSPATTGAPAGQRPSRSRRMGAKGSASRGAAGEHVSA
eukprot:gene25828-57551_t